MRAETVSGLIRITWASVLACVTVSLLMWTFCGTAMAQAGYRLGTGDKLKVTVFGEEDASGEYEIDATGSISARLLGRVMVKGLTISEVEQTLIAQYRGRGFFRNPRISIELINLRPFYILGEVEKRGSYPYVNGLTVAQAVAIAQGYTYRASRTRITIQRSGQQADPTTRHHTPWSAQSDRRRRAAD